MTSNKKGDYFITIFKLSVNVRLDLLMSELWMISQ